MNLKLKFFILFLIIFIANCGGNASRNTKLPQDKNQPYQEKISPELQQEQNTANENLNKYLSEYNVLLHYNNYYLAKESLLEKLRKEKNIFAQVEYLRMLSQMYQTLGNNEEAEKSLLSAIKKSPLDSLKESLSFNLASIYISMRKEDEAIKVYENVVNNSKNPGNKVIACITLGDLFLRNKDFKQAINYYEKIDEDNKTYQLQKYTYLARAFKEEKKYSQAEDYYNKILKESEEKKDLGSSFIAKSALAELALEKGNFETAKKLSKELFKFPGNFQYQVVETIFNLSNKLIEKNKFADAELFLKSILNQVSDINRKKQILFTLFYLNEQIKNYTFADKYLKNLLVMETDNYSKTGLLLMQAQLLESQNKKTEALNIYKKVAASATTYAYQANLKVKELSKK